MKVQMVFADMSNQEFASVEAAIAAGFVQDGESRVGGPLRPMLQGQAKFKGCAGPMYGESYEDGEPCLRYEQWEAYNRLCD